MNGCCMNILKTWVDKMALQASKIAINLKALYCQIFQICGIHLSLAVALGAAILSGAFENYVPATKFLNFAFSVMIPRRLLPSSATVASAQPGFVLVVSALLLPFLAGLADSATTDKRAPFSSWAGKRSGGSSGYGPLALSNSRQNDLAR